MSRIIAGQYGGRRLEVPRRGTRPTTDRVRESMFSALAHSGAIDGARVLDLFAGSGALGLEALSRGAAHATLVESGAPAAAVITRNAATLGCAADATVVKERAHAYVARANGPFDLVLLDPPYDIAPADLEGVLGGLPPLLADGAVVVLEWATRAGEPPWPDALQTFTQKSYGETAVHFAEPIASH